MSEIKSVSLSDNSSTIRISLSDGLVDFPYTDLDYLFKALVQVERLHRQRAASNPNLKLPLPVSSWEVGSDPEGNVVLSFRVLGGIEMSYRIDRTQATGIQESLSVGLGVSNPSIPTHRH